MMGEAGPANSYEETIRAVINRVLHFHSELESSGPNHLSKPYQLFHYTSVEGLRGIVENNHLWASSAYFLNDSAEVTYGYGVLKEALEDWIETCRQSDQSLPVEFARNLLRSFGDDLLNRM